MRIFQSIDRKNSRETKRSPPDFLRWTILERISLFSSFPGSSNHHLDIISCDTHLLQRSTFTGTLLPSNHLISFQTVAKGACPLGALEGIASLPSPDKPLPLRQILTRPVILSIANLLCVDFFFYHILWFHYLRYVHDARPIRRLGLHPGSNRLHLRSLSRIRCFLHGHLLIKSCSLLGERRVYTIGMSCFSGVWILLLGLNHCAWRFGISLSVSTAVLALALPTACMDSAYSFSWMNNNMTVFMTASIVIFITGGTYPPWRVRRLRRPLLSFMTCSNASTAVT